jgi:hypothetical protein
LLFYLLVFFALGWKLRLVVAQRISMALEHSRHRADFVGLREIAVWPKRDGPDFASGPPLKKTDVIGLKRG